MTALRTSRLTRTVLRTVKWIGLIAIGLYGLYLVAMNVFLSTPLFEKAVDAKPEDIDIHYARAWSWFPARVTVKNLSVRGQDSNVQWMLRIDDVTFTCNLWQLAKQRFHATRAVGSGISFRIRENLESPLATDLALRDLPPIDGLGPIGIRPSTPPDPGDWIDAEWHLWTIELENVVAEHVREVWFDTERFQGDARLAGGFYLKPVRDVHVGPIDILVREGEVFSKEHPVLQPIAFQAAVEMREFDPRTTLGFDLLHHMSFTGEGTATVPDLAHTPFGRLGEGRLHGKVDLLEMKAHIVDGIILDGSVLEARSADLELTGEPVRAGAAVTLKADVEKKEARARVEIHHAFVDDGVHIGESRLSADARALDLADPLTDLHVAAELPDVRLEDARSISHHFPSASFSVESGSLRGELRGEAWRATRRLEGAVTLRGERLGVRVGKDGGRATRLDGDFVLHTVASTRPAAARHVIDLQGTTLALRNVRVRGGFNESNWNGDLSLQDSSVDPFAHEIRFVGDVALDARDATPILAVAFGESVPAVVREIAPMPHFGARLHLDYMPGRLVVSGLRAAGGSLDVRGVYVVRGDDGGGAFVVAKGPLSVGLRLDDQGSHVHFFGLDSWFNDETRIASERASR